MAAGAGPTIERVATTDRAWRDLLAAVPHDFAHLPGFLERSAEEVGGTPLALLVTGDGVRLGVPLVVRGIPDPGDASVPTGRVDAASPYGYASPLLALEPDVDPDGPQVAAVVGAFSAGLRGAGVVAAFVRFHPLLPVPHAALERAGPVIELGPTVTADLSRTAEELWADTSGFHRHSIERARHHGYTARMDPGWEHLWEFLEIYAETMARTHARSDYWFSPDYLAGLAAVLGDAGSLCVVERDGQAAAAGIVTEVCGIVQVFLMGTLDEALHDSPAKLLEDHVRTWAKARGDRWYHLGGGVGIVDDSLLRYKLGFSSLTHPYHAWHVNADEAAYAELTARWVARSGMEPPDPAAPHAWFPAYRKPIPAG